MRGLEAVRYSGAGLFFFGAVLLALLAGLAVYGYLSSSVPTESVLTVTKELVPGAPVTAADLQVKKMPASALPQGAIRSIEVAEGRRIRFGLAAGDVLREQHLVPESNGDVAAKLSEMGAEYRAVMLPGDLVPAVDRLIPGDRLELTGVLPVQDQRVNSSVAVPLGIGTVLSVHLADGQADDSTVLVAMLAGDVSKLALARRVGAVTVAVQGAGDPTGPVAPMRLEALTGQQAAAASTAAGK